MWWPMPLIPAPERQTTEVDLDEFKASVVYITSYKPARATQLNLISERKKDKRHVFTQLNNRGGDGRRREKGPSAAISEVSNSPGL